MSEHQSLALLEVYVRKLAFFSSDEYIFISAEWEPALMETVGARELPANWRMLPAGQETRAFGDRWVEEARSAVLAVPSVIVPAETNYLLNPAHPDFRRIKIGKAVPFLFDPRLLQR